MPGQFGNFTGTTVASTANQGLPDFGGTEMVYYNTVAYTDTSAKTLFTLPKGAIITGIMVDVQTAFNSSGTDLLDIGTSASGNAYKDDLAVSSTGQTVTGWVAGTLFTALTADTVVTALYAQSVADASAGLAYVAFRFIML